MNPAVAGLIGAVAPVVVAVIAWFGAKAVRAAQAKKLTAEADRTEAETDRTDAETRRTNAESARIEAESWQMLNGGLSARVTALEQENAELRRRLAHAEEEARQCRIDLDNFRRQYPPPGDARE